ncbi:MAG: hypothetical protein GY822_30940 [Deltaproteobacteria bacterium]|nr:hypothetical protein [Deltaproteobacteria bacterium]
MGPRQPNRRKGPQKAATSKNGPTESTSKKGGHYRVSIAEDLSLIEVQAFFSGGMPNLLRSGAGDCARYLDRANTGEEALEKNDGVLSLVAAKEKCIHYAVDVKSALRTASAKVAATEDASVLLSTDLWLWHPRDREIFVSLDLPKGVSAALPFPREKNGQRFRVPSTSYRWLSTSAFGRFRSFEVQVPGGVLDVHLLHDKLSRSSTKAWMQAAGNAVSTIYGHFPRKRTQVFVRRAMLGTSPVVFGMVARGGGPVATFFVAHDDEDELVGEWVATHELAHLLTPHIQRNDAWLREGVATWYQNIARIRAEQLSPEQGWEKIVNGLHRGESSSSRGTVAEMSEGMRRRFSYTYVYWAGTAAAMLLDVEVRRKTRGEFSLDEALRRVKGTFENQRAISARQFVKLLDDKADLKVFEPFTVAFKKIKGFPEVQSTLWRLGIRERRDGSIWLDDTAEDAWIRKAIEAPVAFGSLPKN